MSNEYQIMIKNGVGDNIGVLDAFLELDLTRTVNDVGVLRLVVPYSTFPDSFWEADNQVEVWRSVNGAPLYLEGETVWFVRNSRKTLSGAGVWGLEIECLDAVDLLKRRIVAYAKKAAQASMTDNADDMCKTIVRQNLGTSATDTARRLSYFAVAADLSQCPSITKEFPHRNVLTTLQEIAQASFEEATNPVYLAYDIVSTVPATGCALEFRTYANQRGIDHRWGTAALPVLLDPEAATLTEVERSIDYSELKNYVYAGGEGTRGDRIIATASDTTSINLSPFNRCEEWVDAANADSAAATQVEADQALRKNRVARTFAGRSVDTPFMVYGQHYRFGDFVTAAFAGEKIDCRVDSVNINIREGKESVTVMLKSDE